MEWIYVVIAGLLEVLSINYMNKWQLVKHLGLKKSGILIIKMVLAMTRVLSKNGMMSLCVNKTALLKIVVLK